jgi:hypothetical protein
LAFFGKKPEKTGRGGMAHPPYGTNFLKRDGFLALNFSMARIFDQRPPWGPFFGIEKKENEEAAGQKFVP